MKFIAMIRANADSESGVMPSTEFLTAMGAFNEALVDAGVMVSGEGLHPTSRGVRIHFDGGETSVWPGPFPVDDFLIAGYWVLETDSLADATARMRNCPTPTGVATDIEIRQIFTMEDFGAEMTPELQEQETRLRQLTDR